VVHDESRHLILWLAPSNWFYIPPTGLSKGLEKADISLLRGYFWPKKSYSLGEPPHSESKGNTKAKRRQKQRRSKSKAKAKQRQSKGKAGAKQHQSNSKGKAGAKQQQGQVLAQHAHLGAILDHLGAILELLGAIHGRNGGTK